MTHKPPYTADERFEARVALRAYDRSPDEENTLLMLNTWHIAYRPVTISAFVAANRYVQLPLPGFWEVFGIQVWNL